MFDSLGSMWKMFIRPPRQQYCLSDLGYEVQLFGTYKAKRTDIVITNQKEQKLQCSLFEPILVQAKNNNNNSSSQSFTATSAAIPPEKFPCVIYCHCNSGSRLEALRILPNLIMKGIGLFCFDFAGSGLSDGEYVTLGINESLDLECVIAYLQNSNKISNIALWGRSMGAVTSIMYAGKRLPQRTVKAIVFDSGFSNLNFLSINLAKQKTGMPNVFIEPALSIISDQVKDRVQLDVQSIDLSKSIHNIYMPIFFVCSKSDSLVSCEHSEQLYARYNGQKWLEYIPGDHNEHRSNSLVENLSSWIASHVFEKYTQPATTNNNNPQQQSQIPVSSSASFAQNDSSSVPIRRFNLTDSQEFMQSTDSTGGSSFMPAPRKISITKSPHIPIRGNLNSARQSNPYFASLINAAAASTSQSSTHTQPALNNQQLQQPQQQQSSHQHQRDSTETNKQLQQQQQQQQHHQSSISTIQQNSSICQEPAQPSNVAVTPQAYQLSVSRSVTAAAAAAKHGSSTSDRSESMSLIPSEDSASRNATNETTVENSSIYSNMAINNHANNFASNSQLTSARHNHTSSFLSTMNEDLSSNNNNNTISPSKDTQTQQQSQQQQQQSQYQPQQQIPLRLSSPCVRDMSNSRNNQLIIKTNSSGTNESGIILKSEESPSPKQQQQQQQQQQQSNTYRLFHHPHPPTYQFHLSRESTSNNNTTKLNSSFLQTATTSSSQDSQEQKHMQSQQQETPPLHQKPMITHQRGGNFQSFQEPLHNHFLNIDEGIVSAVDSIGIQSQQQQQQQQHHHQSVQQQQHLQSVEFEGTKLSPPLAHKAKLFPLITSLSKKQPASAAAAAGTTTTVASQDDDSNNLGTPQFKRHTNNTDRQCEGEESPQVNHESPETLVKPRCPSMFSHPSRFSNQSDLPLSTASIGTTQLPKSSEIFIDSMKQDHVIDTMKSSSQNNNGNTNNSRQSRSSTCNGSIQTSQAYRFIVPARFPETSHNTSTSSSTATTAASTTAVNGIGFKAQSPIQNYTPSSFRASTQLLDPSAKFYQHNQSQQQQQQPNSTHSTTNSTINSNNNNNIQQMHPTRARITNQSIDFLIGGNNNGNNVINNNNQQTNNSNAVVMSKNDTSSILIPSSQQSHSMTLIPHEYEVSCSTQNQNNTTGSSSSSNPFTTSQNEKGNSQPPILKAGSIISGIVAATNPSTALPSTQTATTTTTINNTSQQQHVIRSLTPMTFFEEKSVPVVGINIFAMQSQTQSTTTNATTAPNEHRTRERSAASIPTSMSHYSYTQQQHNYSQQQQQQQQQQQYPNAYSTSAISYQQNQQSGHQQSNSHSIPTTILSPSGSMQPTKQPLQQSGGMPPAALSTASFIESTKPISSKHQIVSQQQNNVGQSTMTTTTQSSEFSLGPSKYFRTFDHPTNSPHAATAATTATASVNQSQFSHRPNAISTTQGNNSKQPIYQEQVPKSKTDVIKQNSQFQQQQSQQLQQHQQQQQQLRF